jgi:hypothetical protein
VLYASYTLYKTRGDQLNQYGYAAFGFTVIPYIIMSFVNLVGNLLTPDYSTLYLVSSLELEEAKSRKDARIDGVVGKVRVSLDGTSKSCFTGHVHSNSYGNFHECSPFEIRGRPYQKLRRSRGGFLRWGFMAFILGGIPIAVIGSLTHFHAAQSTQAQRVLTMFWLSSGVLIGATIPFYGFGFQEIIVFIKDTFGFGKIARAKRQREREIEETDKEREKEAREGEAREEFLVELVEPIEETLERVRVRDLNKHVRSERAKREKKGEGEGEREEREKRERKRKIEREKAAIMFVFLISLVFCAGAIGGFIVVGQMLKDYGSCILLS